MTTPPAQSLAVTLGLVPAAPAPLRLPPLDQRPVPGLSPLEASGWTVDAPVQTAEDRD